MRLIRFFIVFGIVSFELVLFGWIVLTIIPRYFPQTKSVIIPMHMNQLEMPRESSLRHFYTYKPNQKLEYTIPGYTRTQVNYTNADGLVDVRDYDTSKPDNTFRIITLGDSFTQGIFVETQQSYPKILERMLARNNTEGFNKFEVINFGVGGYDIQYAVNKYKLQGVKYQPDLLVWLVKFDDFYLINEKDAGARPTLTNELELIGMYGHNPRRDDFYDKMYRIGELYTRHFGDASVLEYQIFQFKSLRAAYRGPLLVVYFDTEDPMLIHILESLRSKDDQMMLYQISGGSVTRFSDGHPDAGGHRQIANSIYRYIAEWLSLKAAVYR